MRLACLMAGTGRRLMPLTTLHHKACLQLDKRRIIDYQLSTFERAGIGHKTFVLGHGAVELSRVLFESLQNSHFSLLNNPLYHSFNLDWSAWLALHQDDGPVIYYEGDLLIPSSLLKEVNNHPDEICVAMDSACQGIGANAWQLTPQQNGICGGFIALVKLGAAARQFVVEQLAIQPYEGEIQLYKILQRAFMLFSTTYIDTAGRPWIRIDNLEELRRASLLAEEIVNS
ncbi:sugar phosphate nucleotidyltransferase [Winslowiella iniecta]|uniref:Nucleotidyltransferase n=1 Tax=Winslowiella iniecta TaxID=1560201 RepID=A0A0L7SWP6_9GAMM|nr:sugar phosphate nucleotidyltransferase [Winslowiella iniecta]KOC87567.1 nucleotidyltransferase [Winslowiella iniecta]KOC88517.1 nucleotidyltransferase [Winslowiella iniecta]